MRTLFRKWRDFQNLKIAAAYGEQSDWEFRAGNFCDILAGHALVLVLLACFHVFAPAELFVEDLRLGFLAFFAVLMCAVAGFYWAVFKGYFEATRSIFLRVYVTAVIGATLFTGGFPSAGVTPVLLIPLVLSYCLYGGRRSLRFMTWYSVAIFALWLIPCVFDLTLPNYTAIKVGGYDQGLSFMVVLVVVAIALLTFDTANRRFLNASRAAADAKTQFLANTVSYTHLTLPTKRIV